jgi:hypothetical protein
MVLLGSRLLRWRRILLRAVVLRRWGIVRRRARFLGRGRIIWLLVVLLRRRVVLRWLMLRARPRFLSRLRCRLLKRRSLVPTTKLHIGCRRSHADALVANIIGNVDLHLGKVPLHLLLHHVLHEHPALALKLPVTAVYEAQDALPEHFLNLLDKVAHLAKKLNLEVIKSTV